MRGRQPQNQNQDKGDGKSDLRELLRAALRDDPELIRSLLTESAPPAVEDERPLTTEQAAEWCGLRASTLRHYRRTGSGPAFSVIGKPGGKGSLVRYTMRALREWLERTSVDPAAAPRSAP